MGLFSILESHANLLEVSAFNFLGCMLSADVIQHHFLSVKGKNGIKTMLNGTFLSLQEVLGETKSTSRAQSLETARFNLFKLKKRNPKVSALPPTSANQKQQANASKCTGYAWITTK